MNRAVLGAGALLAAGLVAGCSAAGQPSAAQLATPAPRSLAAHTALAPSPVSTQATVRGLCMPGLDDETTDTFEVLTGGINSSPGDTLAEAYQMTLTNTGSTAAEVNGFSAVFYDSSGDETTSDTQSFVNPTFLEPGQSLTWREAPWGTYTSGGGSAAGPYTAGTDGGVDSEATCQLVQWTHP